MVANSSQMAPSEAPLTSTSAVSGQVTNGVTTRPPARHAKVAPNTSQASLVRLLGCMATVLGSGHAGQGGPTLVGQRYGTVTAPARPAGPDFRVGDLGCDAGPASGEPAGMARTGGADVDP
jgi:hypothetical protein